MIQYEIPLTSSGAIFSPARKYRYLLWRIWEEPILFHGEKRDTDDVSMCAFVGLNPSTADEHEDDPTIRRCIGYAKAWGFGGMWMLNLWGLCATKPAELKKCKNDAEVDGPRNMDQTTIIVRNVHTLILAWGTLGAWHGASRDWYLCHARYRANSCVTNEPFKCFGLCKNGEPKHPLYLSKDTELMYFPGYDED